MEIQTNAPQTVIFRNADSFFRYCGWPSVCRDDEGVLYAACSGFRLAHICPFGKTLLFKSFDNGKTWSVPMVVNDTWLDDRDVGLLYLGGKTILLTWFSHPVEKYLEWRDTMPAGCGSILDMYPTIPEEMSRGGSFVRVSHDGGLTWGKTVQVPVSSPHGPALLSDGSLLYLGKEMYAEDGLEKNAVAAYKSCDQGMSWTRLSVLPKPAEDSWTPYDEPHQIELADGRILGGMRWEKQDDATDPCIRLTWSADGGKSWSPARPCGLKGNRFTPPHFIRHSSGALIMTYGRREAPHGERAAVSYDNGESWPEEYILFEDLTHSEWDLGYAATVELADGSLLTVYYQPYEEDEFPSLLCSHWQLANAGK